MAGISFRVPQPTAFSLFLPTYLEANLAKNEGREYETADVLMGRILDARYSTGEQAQLDKQEQSNGTSASRRLARRYKSPAGSPDGLPELPEGWTWATTDQLSLLITDGDHNPPKRVSYGIPHLTAKHIKNGQITFDGASFISVLDFERTRKRLEPSAGDLIITCVGTIGQTAIVPAGLQFSADRNLAAIRPVGIANEGQWLKLVLNSPAWQRRMGEASGSTAQPHLYLGDLRTLPIPIPPHAEQDRIIAEVDLLLSNVDNLHGTVMQTLKRVDGIRQSILQRAFSGQLVPQDRNDEPASVLLERIAAERASAEPPRTRAAARRTKATPAEVQHGLL